MKLDHPLLFEMSFEGLTQASDSTAGASRKVPSEPIERLLGFVEV